MARRGSEHHRAKRGVAGSSRRAEERVSERVALALSARDWRAFLPVLIKEAPAPEAPGGSSKALPAPQRYEGKHEKKDRGRGRKPK